MCKTLGYEVVINIKMCLFHSHGYPEIPMVFPHHGAVLTNLVSMIIPNAHDVKQADIFFTSVRCMLVFAPNGTDTKLQSLSHGWPMLVAAGFHKVYFCYRIIVCWVGVYLSVAWPQNTYISPTVLYNYVFHSVSMLITVIIKFLWIFYILIFMVYLAMLSVAHIIKGWMVG